MKTHTKDGEGNGDNKIVCPPIYFFYFLSFSVKTFWFLTFFFPKGALGPFEKKIRKFGTTAFVIRDGTVATVSVCGDDLTFLSEKGIGTSERRRKSLVVCRLCMNTADCVCEVLRTGVLIK